MSKLLLHNNFRAQLIVPVTIALLLMIVSAITYTVVMQKSSNKALKKEIESSFTEVNTAINGDLRKLSADLGKELESMSGDVSGTIADHNTSALQETAEAVQENLRAMRRMNGTGMVELMGLMATNALITKDFVALNDYVRIAHRNPDVVFLFYLDPSREPLTRYLNRQNSKLKSYLSEDKPDISKIIQAGDDDPEVLVIAHSIESEGSPVGSIVLGLDMTQARQQAVAMKEQFDTLIEKNGSLVQNILGDKAKAIGANLLSSIKRVGDAINASAGQTVRTVTDASDQLSSRTRNFFILGSIVGFLLVLGILFLNSRFILRLLGGEPATMVQLARRIAEGDLTTGTAVSGIPGSLQATLADMTANLHTLIGNIVNNGRMLQATSAELALASEDMTGGAEQSASRANTVAAATEEMSVNMQSMTLASEQAAQNVNVVATAMEEMTSAVQEIARNTEKASNMTMEAVNYAKNSSAKVNQLGKAANEISKVTEVITEISEQTNLLALNATIEAARAGEAGKGFAVVANEIKELAKQTAAATGEIKNKIESIQSSTDTTVSEITEISSVINGVNEIVSAIAAAVEQQSITARDVTANITEAANGIGEVNENISQASTVAGEIARDIAEVSQVSTEAKEGSLRLQGSSRHLKKIAEEINDQTSRFKLGDIKKEEHKEAATARDLSKPLIRWNNSLSVGIESIDRQHMTLVDIINELNQEMHQGAPRDKIIRILDRLISYTDSHFKTEEKHFDRHEYPARGEHKKIHKQLVEQVLSFQEQFKQGKADISVELMEFLKDWLVNHIKKTDSAYGPFLQSKGVS